MTKLREELDSYRKLARMSEDRDVPDLDTGRFKAVFPMGPKGTQKEEDYISRMILRDREANQGY